ncbi:MAG: hypothetical protein OQK24_14450 [Magnetovibrio sp.]|nr:hypothetical protein [Magnetovibrio sp.]
MHTTAHSTHTQCATLSQTSWAHSVISAGTWFLGYALMTVLFFVADPANADTPRKVQNPLVAALPGGTAPVLNYVPPAIPKGQAIELRGACVDGYVLFSVKNGSKSWSDRGYVRVLDARSGEVLHERKMRFTGGQTGSFRVAPKPDNSMYYTLKVMLPGGKMTYVKSFRGRCVAPSQDVRKAMR